jgi:Tol biopolymer transport system component
METIRILFLLAFCFTSVLAQIPKKMESSLVILNIKTGKEIVLLTEQRHFEAPNWSRDGKFLLINAQGFIEKINLEGNNLGKLHTELLNQCNNDHGFSFDGKTLLVSRDDKHLAPYNNSRIYAYSLETKDFKLITTNFPSYWHGISPDGQTVVYCAQRNGQWDVYSKSVYSDEPEKRLTSSEGLDDGPEYSYDGKWIYFNSHRTGRMHLYRMKPDGSEQEQLTTDELDNWFPHPSPSGQYIVYISYLEDQKGAHPFGREVKLRLMTLKTRKVKDLTPVFYGGQGTLNVPSWSPDGKWVAYVRYKKLD